MNNGNLKCTDCGDNLEVSVCVSTDSGIDDNSRLIFKCSCSSLKYISLPLELKEYSFAEKMYYMLEIASNFVIDDSAIRERQRMIYDFRRTNIPTYITKYNELGGMQRGVSR
jgi:hypothetical protein